VGLEKKIEITPGNIIARMEGRQEKAIV